MLQTHHCVTMITKNALIARDIDLLAELAKQSLTGIAISITTLDTELARIMEPRTSSPAARFRTVKELSSAGIPVHVNLAPMIPGLNDHELPQLIQAAADHGAVSVGMQIVRLPGAVADIFSNWLENNYPTQKEKILNRIRATREGKLNNTDFKSRMRGSGILADSILQTFKIWAKRCKLDGGMPKLDETLFVPPSGQLRLF
jgi:DNA repair photolyase